jgi:hypothetical protein
MFKNFTISALMIGAAVLLILAACFSVFFLWGQTGTLFIHIDPFDIFGGVDIHGGLGSILGIFGLMGTLVVINSFLGYILYDYERIFSYIFAYISGIIGILGFILSLYVIAIN